MNSNDDTEWMRQYARDGSEGAFAELVRRHLDLVYSTALRVVGDRQLAEDVCQEVFADLARKAHTLPPSVVLAGWLYRGARYAAANVVRTEVRRKAREAAAMQLQQTEAHPEPIPEWETIRPLLDTVMDDLPEADRDAVVLRYFQQRDLRAVGEALGVGEEAARKRISRALDRLKEGCLRRGVATSTAGLSVILSAHAVHAAPAGLAATVLSGSMGAGAAATAAAAASGGISIHLAQAAFMTKAQTLLVAAAVVAGAAVPLTLQHRTIRQLREENAALQATAAPGANDPASGVVADPPAPVTTFAATAPALSDREKAELLRLRGEVARLKADNQDLVRRSQPRNVSAAARARLATPLAQDPGYVPAERFADSGVATPEAALQTFYWAMQHPESGKLVDVIALPEEIRALQANVAAGTTVRAFPGQAPQEPGATFVTTSADGTSVRTDTFKVNLEAEDGTPDAGTDLQGYRVLSQADISPTEKKVEVERAQKDGTTRVESHTLQKEGDAWKVKPGGGSGMAVFANRIEARLEGHPSTGAPAQEPSRPSPPQ